MMCDENAVAAEKPSAQGESGMVIELSSYHESSFTDHRSELVRGLMRGETNGERVRWLMREGDRW